MTKNILLKLLLFAAANVAISNNNSSYGLIEERSDFSFNHKISDNIRLMNVSVPVEQSIFEKKDVAFEIKKSEAIIKVYPNPLLENELFVSLSTERNFIYKARVYNIIGRIVALKDIEKGNNTISLSDLQEGIYFVDILEDGKTIHSMKTIKR